MQTSMEVSECESITEEEKAATANTFDGYVGEKAVLAIEMLEKSLQSLHLVVQLPNRNTKWNLLT